MLGSLGHCGLDMLCSGHHLGDKSGTPVLVSLAQCGLTRDVWSGESPGSLWSYNLLVVITCHFFFFLASFSRAHVVTRHHLLHRVIQVHKAVGRVLCESCFVIFFKLSRAGHCYCSA